MSCGLRLTRKAPAEAIGVFYSRIANGETLTSQGFSGQPGFREAAPSTGSTGRRLMATHGQTAAAGCHLPVERGVRQSSQKNARAQGPRVSKCDFLISYWLLARPGPCGVGLFT